MKKALAGPAKRTSKRTSKGLPERRAMIAAARRRIGAVLSAGAKRTRQADRALARRIEWARPRLVRRLGQLRARGIRVTKAVGKRLRPVGVLVLRGFGHGERLLRRVATVSARGATRASALLTPARGICLLILGSAVCLVVSQFVTYSSVEIGQPAYAGLTAATPPTVGAESAGEAHSYVLIPLALLAAVVATMMLRTERRGLARIVFGLGLLCIALILIVDLPAGLDVGAQSSRFSGATAVLESGFYAELAAATGLVVGALLYYARPCRIRINLSGRAASARRRRRQRRDSSPRKAARRPLPPRNGAASARASRP